MARRRRRRGVARCPLWLLPLLAAAAGRVAAAAADAEQLHIAVVGSSAVCVSWVSPSGAQENLTVEEVITSAAGLRSGAPGSERSIRPMTTSYKIQGSDGMGGLWGDKGVYTSPLILHAHVPVRPSVFYRYRVGRGSSSAGLWRYFRAPPAVGSERLRLAVVGDLGQTEFSRQTCTSLSKAHEAQAFDMALMLGDLSYADGTAGRWDSWGRFFEKTGCAGIPWLVIPGNHEIEPDALTGEPFLPYRSRWRTPEAAPEQVGNDFRTISWDTYHFESRYDFGGSFFSLRVGPAHFVAINPYTSSAPDSPQLSWLREELARVDRSVTPYLIALTHAPWHHTSLKHRPEVEVATSRLQSAAEPLLMEAEADLVFSGHVHAYERQLPVGGVQHFTVGHGGNHERLYNDWNTSAATGYRQGAHYGWGQLDLWPDAYSWLMWRSDDPAVMDSFTGTARKAAEERTAAARRARDAAVGTAVVSLVALGGTLCCVAAFFRSRRARGMPTERAAFRAHADVLGLPEPGCPASSPR